MCAHIHEETSQENDDTKLARIAQLESDIARLKATRTRRQTLYAKYASARLQHEDLQRFIDTNVLPIFRADIWGHIYEINDSMERLLGYTRDEYLKGKITWDMITPPEYRELDEIAIRELRETGKSKTWEKEYIAKDGSRKHLLMQCVSADNTGEDVLVFVVDRTEQRRLRDEIQQSEEKFRSLAEAMPCIVWIIDREGRTLYHNKRFAEFTGISDLTDGFEWLEAVHPDDRRQFFSRFEILKATGEPLEVEFRFLSNDGQYRWHLARGIPVRDENGEIAKVFGTTIDIDTEKQLEDELRESELRFRTLANAIPQIVWTAEPDGLITFFNDRWFEYTGLTYQQSCENGWELLIHPEDLQLYTAGWKNALATGDSYEAEFRIKRATGLGKKIKDPYRWHLCRAVALRDKAGSIVKWFATWTEIEDQKRRR